MTMPDNIARSVRRGHDQWWPRGASNFNDYRVLRINEMPAIEVYLVQSTEAPSGIGEPGSIGAVPALPNAIFAATGKRIGELPIKGSTALRIGARWRPIAAPIYTPSVGPEGMGTRRLTRI